MKVNSVYIKMDGDHTVGIPDIYWIINDLGFDTDNYDSDEKAKVALELFRSQLEVAFSTLHTDPVMAIFDIEYQNPIYQLDNDELKENDYED